MELKQFITGNSLSSEESVFNTHMDIIAQAFSENRISALVGSGFSKNAKAIKTNIQMPLWSQIGESLMQALGITASSTGISFEDPIRLSSLYVAEYGEVALDTFLKNKIEDNNFEPNEVHKKFVNLNWNNIYTTNYDTLLERADQSTMNKYSVVKKDSDFPLLPKPRIIKLHGSFPSDSPFIMTEEQFRTYPNEHPIFVNSVQQSFIEDTIVLFGFSGTDPNFIKWSGWIIDNLGKKNAKKIYLISIQSPLNAELKYFNDNNITVLDLSIIKKRNPNKTVSDMFEDIFDYWNQFPKSDNNVVNYNKNKIDNWISNLWKPNNDIETEITQQGYDVFIKNVTKKWTYERSLYPKLIVLPMNYNNKLFWKTRNFADNSTIMKNIKNDEQSISFLYEFDWRWRLCNLPFFEQIILFYKKAVCFNDKEASIQIADFSQEIKRKAIRLLISLYKACRENGNNKLCETLQNIIMTHLEILEDDDKDSFYYERCLTAFFNLHYQSVLDLIINWEISSKNIIWKIKKAGLLAEIGKEIDAINILKEILVTVKNELADEHENLEYLFLENLINWLLICIVSSKDIDKDFPEFNINENELRNRNKILASYNCDILDILNSYTKDIYASKQKKLAKKEFDYIRTQCQVIDSDDVPYSSFIYVNIFEKIGFPYKINISSLGNTDSLSVAINNILRYQPDMAFKLIIRSYNEDNVEKNIGVEDLTRYSCEKISMFVNSILNSFKELQTDLSKGNDFLAKDFCNRLIKTYPELLSRLCVKINAKTKKELCSFLITIIKNDLVCRMPNVENFIMRFIRTLTINDKVKLISQLIRLKAPDYRLIDENRRLNPLLYLYPQNELELNEANFDIDHKSITTLIKRYSSAIDSFIKKWYLTDLIIISSWNLYNESNYQLFGDALWKCNLDKYNLPILDGFYKSVVLSLPHPKDIDVEELYSKMLMNTQIPIVSKKAVITYPPNNDWYENIYIPNNYNVYSFPFWEKIFVMIEEQWKEDSKYINDYYKNLIRDNFMYSSLILQRMIVVNYNDFMNPESKMFKYKERIVEQIKQYYQVGINCLESMAAIMLIDKNEENKIFNLFREKIASSERDDVVSVLNSINFLIKLDFTLVPQEKKVRLVDMIIDAVYWQSRGDLEDCIRSCFYIIKLKKELITEQQIEKLCMALKNIKNTLINTEEFIGVRLIKVKSSAAGLANIISIYFKEKNKDVPDEINEWKNIAFDENEFVEIRNQWSAD